MLTLDFIAKLQEQVKLHGNLPIAANIDGYDRDIEDIEYVHHEYPSGSEDSYFLILPVKQ